MKGSVCSATATPAPSSLAYSMMASRLLAPQFSATYRTTSRRLFSATTRRREILDVKTLAPRIQPKYKNNPTSGLLLLQWPEPPRNVLIVPKLLAPHVTQSALEFSKHIHSEYPDVNLIFERGVASEIHESLPFPIYTSDPKYFPGKTDLVATLGGDGTILRAASLFSLHENVPPVLAFSMGTLGFLGEWKFEDYKRAWREVYMSGSRASVSDSQTPHTQVARIGSGAQDPRAGDGQAVRGAWAKMRGKCMGVNRVSGILLRNRLKVGVYDAEGNNLNEQLVPTSTAEIDQPLPPVPPEQGDSSTAVSPSSSAGAVTPAFHAINELVIHRGPNPHLAIIDVFINGRFLTEAVADGILVSTPTGSTAYSLSAGGSIMHPLVKALLITPICARSLSFRPLGVPLNSKVVLRLSEKNRGRDLEVSIDGKRRCGISTGMEIRVEGETIDPLGDGTWAGGVPCVIRSPAISTAENDDGWVGGLNGLLKFNYPFGE